MNKVSIQESIDDQCTCEYFQKFLLGQNLVDFSQSQLMTEKSWRESFQDDQTQSKTYDINIRLLAEITKTQMLEKQVENLTQQLQKQNIEINKYRSLSQKTKEQMIEQEKKQYILLKQEITNLKLQNEKLLSTIKELTTQQLENSIKIKDLEQQIQFKNDEILRIAGRKESQHKKLNLTPLDIKLDQQKELDVINRYKALLAKTESSFVHLSQSSKNNPAASIKLNKKPSSPTYARTITPYSNRFQQQASTYTGNWFHADQQNSTTTTTNTGGVLNDKSSGSQQSRQEINSLKSSLDQFYSRHQSRGSQGQILTSNERQSVQQISIREKNCQIQSTKEQILRLKQNLKHLNVIQ